MKNYVLPVIIIYLFTTCNTTSTEISELIKQTDKIQIVLNEKPDKYLDITERKDIRKFNDYITEDDTPYFKCAYDGHLTFFTKDGSVIMDFNVSDDCAHIIYTYAGELRSKKLTPKGLEYLKSVQIN
ncbi:MAG: hypothetical protein H7Y00_04395 [Fimbriimonadaceae bacterium]|nr:hypothetical protein [Chitinophagales bacterium]